MIICVISCFVHMHQIRHCRKKYQGSPILGHEELWRFTHQTLRTYLEYTLSLPGTYTFYETASLSLLFACNMYLISTYTVHVGAAFQVPVYFTLQHITLHTWQDQVNKIQRPLWAWLSTWKLPTSIVMLLNFAEYEIIHIILPFFIVHFGSVVTPIGSSLSTTNFWHLPKRIHFSTTTFKMRMNLALLDWVSFTMPSLYCTCTEKMSVILEWECESWLYKCE